MEELTVISHWFFISVTPLISVEVFMINIGICWFRIGSYTFSGPKQFFSKQFRHLVSGRSCCVSYFFLFQRGDSKLSTLVKYLCFLWWLNKVLQSGRWTTGFSPSPNASERHPRQPTRSVRPMASLAWQEVGYWVSWTSWIWNGRRCRKTIRPWFFYP